jgi:homospermidine synthase
MSMLTGRSLGMASIGIGLAEIFATDKVQQMMGVSGQAPVLRILGIREVMQGVDILTHRNPRNGLWARVAGDAIDLAVMNKVAPKSKNARGFFTAVAMVAGITAMDLLFAKHVSSNPPSF